MDEDEGGYDEQQRRGIGKRNKPLRTWLFLTADVSLPVAERGPKESVRPRCR